MTNQPKLDEIKEKVSAASSRNTSRLSMRAEIKNYLDEHPFTAVAGGIAVGLLIGTLLPRRTGGRTIGAFAGISGDLALKLMHHGWEVAKTTRRAGQKNLELLGERVSDGTADLRQEIGKFADQTLVSARAAGRNASQQAKSVSDKLASHLRH